MNTQKRLIADSNFCLFNAAVIEGTSASAKGITLSGSGNSFEHFIPEVDPVRRGLILAELSTLILAINEGGNYSPNWPAVTSSHEKAK